MNFFLKPEIIFEELSQGECKNIYENGVEGGLESQAIKKYIDNYLVNNIPIDLDKNKLIDIDLKKGIIKVFNTFFDFKMT